MAEGKLPAEFEEHLILASGDHLHPAADSVNIQKTFTDNSVLQTYHDLTLDFTSPAPQDCHISQSDSGIFLSPLSQVSLLSPLQTAEAIDGITQVDQTHNRHDTGEKTYFLKEAAEKDVGGDNDNKTYKRDLPSAEKTTESSPHNHSSGELPCNLTLTDGKSKEFGSEESDESQSHLLFSSHPKTEQSPSTNTSRCSSPQGKRPQTDKLLDNEFTTKTKYLVLQFLRQATSEEHLQYLSQNSTSGISESEPRFSLSQSSPSYGLRLLRQPPEYSTHSSPTPTLPRLVLIPQAKIKGSRSSPDFNKEAHFFKEVPELSKCRSQPPEAWVRGVKLSPTSHRKTISLSTTKAGALQSFRKTQCRFARSFSQNTDSSEYFGDVDDELNTSSLDSVTSATFCKSLIQFIGHGSEQSLSTILSEVELSNNLQCFSDTNSPVAVSSVNVSDISLQLDSGPSFEAPTTLPPPPPPPNHHHAMLQGPELEYMPLKKSPLSNLLTEDLSSDGLSDDNALLGEQLATEILDYEQEEKSGACGVSGSNHGLSSLLDESWLKPELPGFEIPSQLAAAVDILQKEILEELSSIESEPEVVQFLQQVPCSQNLSQTRSSLGPETVEIARVLAQIGDDVQRRYFDSIDQAVWRLVRNSCFQMFTYENFREAAMIALDRENIQGWKQVAVLLLYSQRIALTLASYGHRELHRIVDYTVKLIADKTADFIIQQGGWRGLLSAADSSSSPSSPDITFDPVPLPVELTGTRDLHQMQRMDSSSAMQFGNTVGNRIGEYFQPRHMNSAPHQNESAGEVSSPANSGGDLTLVNELDVQDSTLVAGNSSSPELQENYHQENSNSVATDISDDLESPTENIPIRIASSTHFVVSCTIAVAVLAVGASVALTCFRA